ncbi:hypothetical protein BU17DRAFT_72391 [Hysterangium stoloniferum]|nr:hypothetical protein BU17DRAFT_72391 [Hysterangium stoloniferum]
MLVGGLLQSRQDGGVTLIGPSGRPKPMVVARRWIGCSGGDRAHGICPKVIPNHHYVDHAITFRTSWVLAMLLVPFVIAYKRPAATARDHLPVSLDVVRSAPPTTIHGPVDKCDGKLKVINSRMLSLLPHEIIGHPWLH